ncbi:hypothetical protein LUZ60_005671 [Juncus effusus]|nr:hypothetical protein LUZ60_005671 [Juncus effusus]
MISLTILELSRNQLSGELPKCLWEMKNLGLVGLESNNLSGNVPISRGLMPPLLSIKLANNSFTGEFPSALKECSELIVLDLGINHFSGEIPEWIGYNFPSLQVFSLSWNSFNGSIPPLNGLKKLQVLDFSHNNLTGSIPSSVGNLTSMKILQQLTVTQIESSSFIYYKSISITWKGSELSFEKNILFVKGIDFSSNYLTQEVPRELTTLFGLTFLNLSENYLTDQIQERIGDLRQLQFLDLSNNEISGVIPTSMANLGFLGFLNLSYNNLYGEIPTGNQLQTLDNPLSYVGNEGLCGFPLAKACSVDEPPTQNQSLPDDDEEKIDKILFYGFIVFGFAFGFWSFFGVLFFNKTWRWNYFYFIDSMQQKISEKF